MQCVADQEDVGIELDYDKAVRHRDELLVLQSDKTVELQKVMPQVPKYTKKVKPKITHKQDGTLSSHGEKWFKLLRDNKLPVNYNGELKVITKYEDANPGSSKQVKDWLHSLGWKPATYKYSRDSEGNEKKVEQVRKDGELCKSVVKLISKEPNIAVLEGLTVIQHRLGVFQGFIDTAYQKDGKWYVKSEVGGLTNTLRFKHKKPIANMPKVGVAWGEEIRGCLIATGGKVFCGSDLSSLESTTKRHYIYPLDPDYVAEMSQPGFDEHLDLAKFAGVVTQEDIDRYNKDGDPDVKKVRHPYKQANYSAIYGIGAAKLARELGMSVAEAKSLLEAYWERNKAVTELVKQQTVKTLKNGQMWLYNPVSGFWISLRFEKDIFSSLNQSTGVYVFDKWVALCKNSGITIAMQYHDEHLDILDEGGEDEHSKKVDQAIDKLNDMLKLNVPIAAESAFGKTYSEVH